MMMDSKTDTDECSRADAGGEYRGGLLADRHGISRLAAALMWVLVAATGCDACTSEIDDPDGGTLVDTGPSGDAGTLVDGGDGEGDTGVTADLGVDDMGVVDPDQGGGGGFDFGGFDFGTDEDMGQVEELRVDGLVPSRGPVEGGSSFVVEGVGFTEDTIVYFGARQADVELTDGGDFVGLTPPGAATGAVNVKIIDPEMGSATLVDGFTYTTALEVDRVVPDRIPTEGGIVVTLEGRGLTPETRVSFGGVTASRHTFVDDRTMRVLAPAHPAGAVSLRATNRDDSVELPEAVTYFEKLSIESVTPPSGTTAGGDTVTIEGAAFEPGMSVEFGGAEATVVSVEPDGSAASVETPPGAAGLVAVRVSTDDGQSAIAPDAFAYVAPGAAVGIDRVRPDTGPQSGGTEVLILGSGLDAAGATVTFGGQAATVLERGPGHLLVQIPMGMPGPVDVTVDAGADGTATLPGAFTYLRDLWLDRVSPAQGSSAGGETITLEGEGFTGVQRVTFGGVAAMFTVVDDNTIEATAPAHTAGEVDVVVERAELSARLFEGYTYTEALEIWGATPVRGSVAGGTYVEIRGRGFVGALDAFFGDTPGVGLEVLDAQTLAVRSPPHASGSVELAVERDANDRAVAPDPFVYFNPGSRFGGASGNDIQGSVNVTVYSTGGGPIEGAFVMLSTNVNSPYTGYTDANGMVTLSGPNVLGQQTVSATAAGHSSATVQHVDAENITIFLWPKPDPDQGQPPPGPVPATFKGQLTGLDKIANVASNEYLMAKVYVTRPAPNARNLPPGNRNTLYEDGEYEVRSRLGDVALVAIGGVFNIDTQEFRPLRMGIARYLFASEGKTYDVDIELNIRLDKSLSAKLNNVQFDSQRGPIHNRVTFWLDLGYEGVFGVGDHDEFVAEGRADIQGLDHLPPLSGELANASFTAIGGSYTIAQAPQGGLEPESIPDTIGYERGITTLGTTFTMPGLLGIPRMTSPQPGLPATDNTYHFSYSSPDRPSIFLVQVIRPGLVPEIVYEVVLPGSANSFKLPDYPSFQQQPADSRPNPYPGEPLYMLIRAIEQPGLTVSNFTYNDLRADNWTASATNIVVVPF